MQLQSDANNSISEDGQFFVIRVGQNGEGNNVIRIDSLSERNREPASNQRVS